MPSIEQAMYNMHMQTTYVKATQPTSSNTMCGKLKGFTLLHEK